MAAVRAGARLARREPVTRMVRTGSRAHTVGDRAVVGSERFVSNVMRSITRRGRRPILRKLLWWVCGVHTALCLFATAAAAATFVLANGDSFEGEVIHATRNTLMVREAIGSVRQLSHGELERVEITTSDGTVVSGPLLAWRDGVYEIEADGRRVKLGDGKIVGEAEPEIPVLIVSPAEAVEGTGELEFHISLSRPASKAIFLVYGTFDRAAKDGEDYRQEQGSLVIPAGDVSAVVRVPVIDDDLREDDETFELFVSADKDLVTIENNRAVGTIVNDDE